MATGTFVYDSSSYYSFTQCDFFLVNAQYILETSHWLITSPYEHDITVNFINPVSAVEVNQNGILVQPLRSNQLQSWFGRWGSERDDILHSLKKSAFYLKTLHFMNK